MDELRPEELAAVVAAWHNRHPLARRVLPAQVQGIGWVALPFVQRPGASPGPGAGLPVLVHPVADPAAGQDRVATSLRERAQARAAGTTASADERLLPPVPPALPQRLLAGFKQLLRASLAAPARLRLGWQAAAAGRAQWRWRKRALQPAFSEDFIAPLSPRQVARWALRHGQLQAQRASLPLREVRPDAAWSRQDTGLVTLYLATAAVEVAGRRARVLLTADGAGPLLGPRLMSPQRGAAVLGLLAAVALGIARPSLPPPADWPGVAAAQQVLARWAALAGGEAGGEAGASGDGTAVAAVAAGAADNLPPSTGDAAADASALAMAEAAAAADAAFAAPADAASAGAETPPIWGEALAADPAQTLPARELPEAAPAASHDPMLAHASPPAPGTDPEGGASTLPPDDPPPPPAEEPFRPGQRLVRPLDEATKAAARRTVAALRLARGDPPPSATAPSGPVALAMAPPPASPTADAGPELGPAFALTTRPLRTRAESEQVQVAVRALLAQHTAEPLLVELMPAGDDWRVVCWPFARRQDAQLARALLLTRGLRMEPVAF